VFTGEGLQKLATFQAELYKKEAGDNFKETVYQNLLANPCGHPRIRTCMKRDQPKSSRSRKKLPRVLRCAEHVPTTTAYGIAGYWTTGGPTYKASAKEFFGLGEDDKLLGFFYVAHVAVPSPDSIRKPLEEKVEWVRRREMSNVRRETRRTQVKQ
jgi:hypothetical protein